MSSAKSGLFFSFSPLSFYTPAAPPAAELLQFNLSQPVASVIIGCEQMAPLEQNVQAALSFTPISESGKQKLQEKVAPSRSAWENFLRTHEDSIVV